MLRMLELVILLVAVLSPFFYLDSHIGQNDAEKIGAGIAQAAAVAAAFKAYQMWKNGYKKCPICKRRMKNCICED